MSSSSSSDEYESLTSGSDLESCSALSDDNIQDTGEEFIPYDEALEPVANEEEAAQYLEELAAEEEEGQTLLSRFSGEEDVQDWYVYLYYKLYHGNRQSDFVFNVKIHLDVHLISCHRKSKSSKLYKKHGQQSV